MKQLSISLALALLAAPAPAAQEVPEPAQALSSSLSGTGLSPAMDQVLPPLDFGAPQVCSGDCGERGLFALVVVPIEEGDSRGQATARLRAQAELTSFLGSEVRSASEREIEVQGDSVRSHFSSSVRSSSAAVINGLTLCDVRRNGARLYLIYSISDRSLALSRRLEVAAQGAWQPKGESEGRPAEAAASRRAEVEEGSIRVFAMGFALIKDESETATFERAMANARAQAVEQTRGALLISRASWSQVEGRTAADAEAFSFAAGQLDHVELLHTSRVEGAEMVVVHIAATVGPLDYARCLEAYVSAFGAPRFAVIKGEEGVVPGTLRAVRATLLELGLDVAQNQDDADYLVEVSTRFESSQHPLRKTPVTSLVPDVRVVSRVDATVVAEPAFERAIGSSLTDVRHRERDCVEAFRRALGPALKEDLGEVADRQLRFGRRLRVALELDASAQPRGRSELASLVREVRALAGVSTVRSAWEGRHESLVLDVTTHLRTEDLEHALIGLVQTASASQLRASVERSTATGIDMRVRRLKR